MADNNYEELFNVANKKDLDKSKKDFEKNRKSKVL